MRSAVSKFLSSYASGLAVFVALGQLSFVLAETEPPVIPGTGIETPTYDPAHGGWDSELAASVAQERLGPLKETFTSGSLAPELGEIADENFRGAPLRAASPKIAFQDDQVIVRRSGRDASEKLLGPDGWIASVESLRKALNPEPLHVKFKTVGVEMATNAVKTRFEIRLDGHDDKGRALQVNTVWDCAWKRSGQALALQRLIVEDYEEVITSSKRPNGLFTDVTGGVLGRDPAFKEQLAYGLDHWLARLDAGVGIKVGGWNGLAVGDANGDGYEDLYVCQSGGLPNRLFLARADGSAGDVAAAAGVDWLETSRGALFVDLDNDGDQDLVVAVTEGLLIHENDGSGRFTVRSARVLPFAVPYSIAAADYDQDGDLDLFAACYDRRGHVDRNVSLARPVPYHDANNGGRNALLRNEGEFRFRHVTKQVGLDTNNTRYSYAATWADYDQDGDLDLYVANDFGRNNLYRHDRTAGRSTFVDVAEEMGVLDIAAGMSAAWGDYNNDGRFDLYVSNMFSSAGNRIVKQDRFLADEDSATKDLFLRHARGNSLFQNGGPGKPFADVSLTAAVTQGRWAWGSAFADLNNDGWQDLVVANGFITQEDTGDL